MPHRGTLSTAIHYHHSLPAHYTTNNHPPPKPSMRLHRVLHHASLLQHSSQHVAESTPPPPPISLSPSLSLFVTSLRDERPAQGAMSIDDHVSQTQDSLASSSVSASNHNAWGGGMLAPMVPTLPLLPETGHCFSCPPSFCTPQILYPSLLLPHSVPPPIILYISLLFYTPSSSSSIEPGRCRRR
jgi:hypothetical protein